MKRTGNGDLRRREPLTDSKLLLLITVCIFVGMYLLAMLILGGFAWHQLALAFFILVLVFFTHRANIGRLINGTEPVFRAGRGK